MEKLKKEKDKNSAYVYRQSNNNETRQFVIINNIPFLMLHH